VPRADEGGGRGLGDDLHVLGAALQHVIHDIFDVGLGICLCFPKHVMRLPSHVTFYPLSSFAHTSQVGLTRHKLASHVTCLPSHLVSVVLKGSQRTEVYERQTSHTDLSSPAFTRPSSLA